MNEPLEIDAPGPGFLVPKIVSHMTAKIGKIQTLERDSQGSKQSDESECCVKLAKFLARPSSGFQEVKIKI